jgi:hypothetical protein
LHFKHLIEEPLKRNRDRCLAKPVVVALDALDECGVEGSWQRKLFLTTLNSWSQFSLGFKLLVTSRNESDIRKSLASVSQHVVLRTGDLVEDQSSNDIRLFLQSRFAEIAEDYSPSLPPTWPGESTIELLTQRAAGLFIWAETVTKFVRKGAPVSQLKLILSGSDKGVNIDSLYRKILDISFGKADHDTLESFKTVVSSVILAKSPLSRDSLKSLLAETGEESTSVDFVLNRLSTVISTGESDNFLRINHQSFPDYLIDIKRCSKRYYIDRAKQSLRLVKSCLRMMNDRLKFNICGLETSYCPNDDVPNLMFRVDPSTPSRVEASIPSSLSYSCLFWGQHLQDTDNADSKHDELLPDMKTFLKRRLLYWLEALSLIGDVPAAIPALVLAASWSRVSFQSDGICLDPDFGIRGTTARYQSWQQMQLDSLSTFANQSPKAPLTFICLLSHFRQVPRRSRKHFFITFLARFPSK